MYPVRIARSAATFVKATSNRKKPLISLSAITNGLKAMIFLTILEIPSIGRIIPEKNKKRLPKETEARTAVSSDEKTYPRIIPIKVNTDDTRKSTKKIEGNFEIDSDRKKSEIIRIMESWNIVKMMFVK